MILVNLKIPGVYGTGLEDIVVSSIVFELISLVINGMGLVNE